VSIGLIINITVGVVVLLVVGFVVYRRVPKRLKTDLYASKWKELQAYCRDKTTWPQAIAEADKLLDKALRRRKFKGKSMGERMVSAQRIITNNDAMWFAHNLAKKVLTDPDARLKEAEVKAALLGFRQALKDIGALKIQKTDQKEAES
jgi:hypothetical protein